MKRRADVTAEGGFTLVEVLLVSALFLVVLTATVMSMASFERLNKRNHETNDQVERTRRAVDRGMRQLRNLASRPVTGEATIHRADPNDFVFQTSDPARTWVRYCTQAQPDGSRHLWSLASPAVAAPTATDCPALASWPTRDRVATSVTNQAAGRDVPLFSYGRMCTASSPPGCATAMTSITSVNMQVMLDDNLARDPAEVRVSSGVFLRNQNEKPTALFTAKPSSTSRSVLLNASDSSDPEGRTLRYYWFRTANYTPFTCNQKPADGTVLGLGVTLTYTFPDADGPADGTNKKNFTLVVCDPGDLQATYSSDVTIPS